MSLWIVVVKALGIWVLLLALAMLNGVLREAVLIPRLGSVTGLVISGLLLCSFILGVAYLCAPRLGMLGSKRLWLLGTGWLLLTLGFEFSLGLLRGKSVVEILDVYTFKGGNLWLLVLMTTLAAPWMAAKFATRH